MKAKEYAAQYNAASDKTQALADVANAFIREFGRMAVARHISSGASLLFLLRETEQKWRKFVELAGEPIRLDGVRIVLRETHPDLCDKLGLPKYDGKE